MGTTLNSVEHLGPPFRSVDEQVFVIPKGSHNEIPNRFFKLILMLEGNCFHEVDSEGPVRFETGDIIVLPCTCRQRYWPLSPRDPHRMHALRLIFDPKTFPPYPAGHRPTPQRGDVEKSFSSYVRHHLQEGHHLSRGQDAAIRDILTDLRQEAEQRRSGFRFRVTALCTMLVIQVVRQIIQSETPQQKKHKHGRPHLVLHTKEYLVKNLNRDLHLNEIAWHLHVSAEHLARVFKQETGQTVFTSLQQMRLEKAKTFLIGTDKSITDIAGLTGFSSVALFSRNFKRAIGASPLQYRQERWNGAVENG
jgi:AraC-like DNA-binding protein